jgi:rRNA maturation endonuclease Nob1
MQSLVCVEKMNKKLLQVVEVSIILGMSLFAAVFSWNLDHNIQFTLLCTGCFALFGLATCPSIQNGD